MYALFLAYRIWRINLNLPPQVPRRLTSLSNNSQMTQALHAPVTSQQKGLQKKITKTLAHDLTGANWQGD